MLPEQVVGHSDCRQLRRDAVAVAQRGIDFREPGRQPLRLVAAGQLVDHAPSCLDSIHGCGQKLIGLLDDGIGLHGDVARRRVRLRGLAGFGFQGRDCGCARIGFGAQPHPLGEQGGRRAAGCGRGRGDQLGFPHVFGQRSDCIGSGLGGGLPRTGGLLLLGERGQLDGQRGVPLHTIVDLGDGRRALLDFGIGGLERFDGRRPLTGGTAGRGEVAGVLGVDPVDEQRLGSRQRSRIARRDVECPGQRVATRQIHRVGRR